MPVSDIFFQPGDILPVDPLFGISAAAADIAVHQYRRKDSAPGENVVADAVSIGAAAYAQQIGASAFGTGMGVFHRKFLSF